MQPYEGNDQMSRIEETIQVGNTEIDRCILDIFNIDPEHMSVDVKKTSADDLSALLYN